MDSWYYDQSLDALVYSPQENYFLDIWLHKDVNKFQIREGTLTSENLDDHLSNKTSDVGSSSCAVGALRLIYSYIDDERGGHSDSMVCWSRPDFIKIIESYQLPKRFTQMISRRHCFFAQCCPAQSDDETERFSYIFSTMFRHQPLWFMAASWDPETKITYGFMQLCADPEREYIPRIKAYLTNNLQQAVHPMVLPVLIMDLETTATLADDEEWTEVIQEVEDETGQQPRDSRVVDPLEINLSSIVQRLNGCSCFLSLIERESEAILLHLNQTRQAVLDLEDRGLPFRAVTRTLVMHIDFLIESRKNLFLRLQNLQRRSQMQLNFTYNFLAQRDNKLNIAVARDSRLIALASSRDSMAMKTVAILTIAFLPGTFLSSLFAMPFFDWRSGSGKRIVSKDFWIYWAFAIPLTILVLGAWAVWVRSVLKKHKQEQHEVQSQGLYGPKSEPRSEKSFEASDIRASGLHRQLC